MPTQMSDEDDADRASAPSRRWLRGGRPSLALAAVVAAVLLYGVVYPNLSVVVTSLTRGGGWTLANYADFFARRAALEALVLERKHFAPGEACAVELPREHLKLIGPD